MLGRLLTVGLLLAGQVRGEQTGRVDALALGFADAVPAERLGVFIKSFLQHSPAHSELVLFAYDNPPNVSLYGPRVSVVRSARSEGVDLSNHRYALFREHVEHLFPAPRLLLNSDVSDVVFQANPFVGDAAGVVYTSLEGDRTLGDGSLVAHFNNKWISNIQRCGKIVQSSDLDSWEVVCSGFSTGRAQPMLAYWRAMERELKTCFGNVKGQDQGVHEYLIHQETPNGVRFELLDSFSSPLATLSHILELMRKNPGVKLLEPSDYTRTALGEQIHFPDALVPCVRRTGRRQMCYDESGYFYNAEGNLPAVVHQYNRFHELEQLIFHRWL
ncbi:hypothetical protein AB1Y20_015217 [Prymnesium parvum]|uniref:Protein xylosyltransferase n=1 Tax=Prymnesium parvum TaxID=97485 RepID=A0AB34JZG6_PRYPA